MIYQDDKIVSITVQTAYNRLVYVM